MRASAFVVRASSFALLAVSFALPATADELDGLPTPLSLEGAVRFAQAHRAEITAARKRAGAAEQRPAIVSALEEPMVSVSLDHLPFKLHGADVSLTIEQRFPISGLRGHRARSAEADARRLRAEGERVALDVELDAARAFLGRLPRDPVALRDGLGLAPSSVRVFQPSDIRRETRNRVRFTGWFGAPSRSSSPRSKTLALTCPCSWTTRSSAFSAAASPRRASFASGARAAAPSEHSRSRARPAASARAAALGAPTT